jgi:hypothetical protein
VAGALDQNGVAAKLDSGWTVLPQTLHDFPAILDDSRNQGNDAPLLPMPPLPAIPVQKEIRTVTGVNETASSVELPTKKNKKMGGIRSINLFRRNGRGQKKDQFPSSREVVVKRSVEFDEQELNSLRGKLCGAFDIENPLNEKPDRNKNEIARDARMYAEIFSLEIRRDDSNAWVLMNINLLLERALRKFSEACSASTENHMRQYCSATCKSMESRNLAFASRADGEPVTQDLHVISRMFTDYAVTMEAALNLAQRR